jgi:hypothetical protein
MGNWLRHALIQVSEGWSTRAQGIILRKSIAMSYKPLLTALPLIPLSAITTASAETRPNLDEQVLEQRYGAFV